MFLCLCAANFHPRTRSIQVTAFFSHVPLFVSHLFEWLFPSCSEMIYPSCIAAGLTLSTISNEGPNAPEYARILDEWLDQVQAYYTPVSFSYNSLLIIC